MRPANWRQTLDPYTRKHLEIRIKETAEQTKAYSRARNVGDAQLWIAVANLSKELDKINLKLDYIEGSIKPKKATKRKTKRAKKIERALKKL